MPTIGIIIPTCKQRIEVERQVSEIRKNTKELQNLFVTCIPQSAAKNRNLGHSLANSDIVISCDDDITGYFPGWEAILVKPLLDDPSIRFSSARFMKSDGKTLGDMMFSKFDLSSDLEEVLRCPTGCFAYRKSDFDALIGFQNECSWPFDENFKGSGFEDTALCVDLKKKFPDTKIVISNNCKLVHINEMKYQKENYSWNRSYFYQSRGVEA